MKAQARREETRRATYQDVLDAPPHKVAEVISGTLHTHPRPAARHAWASSGLGMKIDPPFNYGDDGPGGWWIVFKPELHLGEDIVVPDLAGWRRETMPKYPDAAYSRSRRTGSARCSRRPHGDWIRLKSGISTPAKASAISGSSIPTNGRSRPSRCARDSGCFWRCSPMTHQSRFLHTMPSPSRSTPSGPR